VSTLLANTLDAQTVCIEGDKFWQFIVKPAHHKRQTTMRIAIKSMMLSALPYSRGGFYTIVDFSVAPWHLELFKEWMGGTNLDYFILLPSKRVCTERVKSRKEGRMDDYAAFDDFYDAFNDNTEEFEKFAIRNDDASVAELVKIIAERIASGENKLELGKAL
jgi:hypothetical protein